MGMFENWNKFNLKRGRLDTVLIEEEEGFLHNSVKFKGLDFQKAQAEKKQLMDSYNIKKENDKNGRIYEEITSIFRVALVCRRNVIL